MEYGNSNKVFTKDAADAARALLRRKLNQVSTGLDPEIDQAVSQEALTDLEKGVKMNRYENLLLKALENLAPERLKEMRRRGELTEYLRTKAAAAQKQKNRMVAAGMLDHEAEEVVRRDLLAVG